MTRDYPYEWCWMTTQERGTPHARALQDANPGLAIHVSAVLAGATPEDAHHAWRNCDRNIRAWWRENRDRVSAGSMVFAEYDVLCNVDTRTVLPRLPLGVGICGPHRVSRIRDRRRFWPFADIPRLPLPMRPLAIAIAPLAVLIISRAALDLILRPELDEVFAADIFCELRLPTVIRWAGLQVASMDLQNVHVTRMTVDDCPSGIYHPVKS